MKLYELGDCPTPGEFRALGLELKRGEHGLIYPSKHKVRGVYTGEKRPPLKGEWYLSGCNEQGQPETWRAPNDLGTAYHIARLVRIEVKTTIEIVSRN